MRFESDLRSGVRVVTVLGRWTGGPDDDALRVKMLEWMDASERDFVMDMSQLEILNSIGLGRLVSYYTTVTREGGKLALAGMQEKHRRAAYVARILDLFEEFDTVDHAVMSIGESS